MYIVDLDGAFYNTAKLDSFHFSLCPLYGDGDKFRVEFNFSGSLDGALPIREFESSESARNFRQYMTGRLIESMALKIPVFDLRYNYFQMMLDEQRKDDIPDGNIPV